MTTLNIRDKLNLLDSQIQQEEQQRFAQQLIVEDATESTADAEIDKSFKAAAANAATVMKACEHRLRLRIQKREALQKDLDAQRPSE